MSTREQICHLAEQHLRRRGTNICNMNKFFDMLETFFKPSDSHPLFALFLQFFFSHTFIRFYLLHQWRQHPNSSVNFVGISISDQNWIQAGIHRIYNEDRNLINVAESEFRSKEKIFSSDASVTTMLMDNGEEATLWRMLSERTKKDEENLH